MGNNIVIYLILSASVYIVILKSNVSGTLSAF